MPVAPHSPVLLSHIELLVDAVRGHLSPHRSGVGVHNGEQTAEVHAAPGMGHAGGDDNHIRRLETFHG